MRGGCRIACLLGGVVSIAAIIVARDVDAQALGPSLTGVTFFGGAGDQSGFSVAAAPDGVYLSGYSSDHSSIVAKFNKAPTPAPIWSVDWPYANASPRHEALFGTTITSEGAYFSGWSYSQTTDDIGDKEGKSVLVKFPLAGPTGPAVGGAQWVAKPLFFPGYQGYELFQGATNALEGGSRYIYTSGQAQSGFFNSSTTLSKYDTAGNVIWSRILSSQGSNQFSAGASVTTLDGGLYVAGYQQSSPADSSLSLWKYDKTGGQAWLRTFQPAGGAIGESVAGFGGALYVAGYMAAGAAGGEDAVLLKYDEAGNLVWSRTWGGAKDDVAFGVTASADGVFVVGETASFGAGGKDAFLLGFDPITGTLLSSSYFGGALDDGARGIAEDGSDLYVVGDSRSFTNGGNIAGQDDLLLLHYSLAPAAVPEPGAIALLAAAISAGLWQLRHRPRNRLFKR